MDEVNYDSLIHLVETDTKKSYRAAESNGKANPNVANLGAKVGDIAKLERPGEYYGIAVEFLEDVKPLLTDKFVGRILFMLKKEDYITPLSILELTSLEQLIYILDKWFESATTKYDNMLKSYVTKKYPVFDDWIRTVRADPIMAKMKVVEIGQNQNTLGSVLPPEWIDKEFASGEALHEAMTGLESRIGKPPVTYAIIYSMIIQKFDTLIKDISNLTYEYIFYVDLVKNKINSTIETKPKKNYDYVKYENILIGFKLSDILEPKGAIEGEHSQKKLREVGILVSRLQKAIRRGRYASKALVETVDALNVSPNYNLPEHGFLRVSASKQLVWRLFISILEDCRPYQPIKELSLLDLILLVLITQKCQEYKFTEPLLELIKMTAVLAQFNDSPDDLFDWRSEKESDDVHINPKSEYHTALSLALNNIIMMRGDNKMLRKLYSVNNLFEPFMVPKEEFHDHKVYEDVVLSSIDPHSKTYIILYYQACIPISLTTKEIAGYIWDKSSSYNVRSGEKPPKPDPILRQLQKYFFSGEREYNSKIDENPVHKIKKNKPTNHAKRTSFLILFGKKYKHKGKEIILAGTTETPVRVKINNEWSYESDSNYINAYPKQKIYLTDIDPPFGYKWTKSKMVTEIIDGTPVVDGEIIPFFDGSSLIESIVPDINENVDRKTYQLILEILAGLDVDFDTLLMFRRKAKQKPIRNWLLKSKDIKKFDIDLLKLAYTKIFNQFNNIIMVGPVDRMGHKMQNSINYLLEGKLWAVFNLFYYLYPATFKPSGAVNFYVNKETFGYIHLIQTLERILFDNQVITGMVPTVKTELWDHQKESVNRIMAGFGNQHVSSNANNNKLSYIKGFGDASDVGAGKTLTSLKIATELIKINEYTYSGILVMLPGNKLINTWKTEIEKHTEGFDVKFQEHDANIGPIERNTILVTTMGRMRDHPISHKWLLVIIDECLTVQNKNALQTQEAWMQSLMSKHLVMMSATFFRTRFDKLYYMLKMLQTGLPEQKEYLNTILLESIVSQVSGIKRKWTSNINYFELDDKSRKEYDTIERSNLNTETKFSKLTSYLVSSSKTNESVTKQLGKLIKSLEKKNHRCLIYARSMAEAELWSDTLAITIYPKKGNHTIVTYNDGTYGLNDLIIYDTIVMRIPPPDKLPQIKGRLDRPGQKSDNLLIEYFILKDTIEEGLILRMNIASQFIQQYIMPLAKFYDISINYKKYLEENEENE